MLGHTAGVLLANPDLLQLRYAHSPQKILTLTIAGSCDTEADTDRSNNSLYVTAAIDIFSDFLSESPSTSRTA